MTPHEQNLLHEREWVDRILKFRLGAYQKHPLLREAEPGEASGIFQQIPPPALETEGSPYASRIEFLQLSPENRLILALTFIPHFDLNFYSRWIHHHKVDELPGNPFAWFRSPRLQVFLPTGLTAALALFGNTGAEALAAGQLMFAGDQVLASMVKLSPSIPGDPWLSGALQLRHNWPQLLIIGQPAPQQASIASVDAEPPLPPLAAQ